MLQELYRKVRGVLNKLTPQKFRTLVSQVQALPIDNSDRLKGVINLVFEKVSQPSVGAAALKYKCHVDKNSLFETLHLNFLVIGGFS
jgi:translation initiation factor 4G